MQRARGWDLTRKLVSNAGEGIAEENTDKYWGSLQYNAYQGNVVTDNQCFLKLLVEESAGADGLHYYRSTYRVTIRSLSGQTAKLAGPVARHLNILRLLGRNGNRRLRSLSKE